jgi:hypothetical protein
MANLQRNMMQIYATLDNKHVALAKLYYSYQIVVYLPVKMTDWQIKINKTRTL